MNADGILNPVTGVSKFRIILCPVWVPYSAGDRNPGWESHISMPVSHSTMPKPQCGDRCHSAVSSTGPRCERASLVLGHARLCSHAFLGASGQPEDTRSGQWKPLSEPPQSTRDESDACCLRLEGRPRSAFLESLFFTRVSSQYSPPAESPPEFPDSPPARF